MGMPGIQRPMHRRPGRPRGAAAPDSPGRTAHPEPQPAGAVAPRGSHLLCALLTGQAPAQFLAGLNSPPFLAKGETCPAAAELMEQLAFEQAGRSRVHSQIAFALLCELAEADAAAPALPPLVAAAMEDIRQNYAGLYGVEELSERLCVSKSHLVRAFTHAVGALPGAI